MNAKIETKTIVLIELKRDEEKEVFYKKENYSDGTASPWIKISKTEYKKMSTPMIFVDKDDYTWLFLDEISMTYFAKFLFPDKEPKTAITYMTKLFSEFDGENDIPFTEQQVIGLKKAKELLLDRINHPTKYKTNPNKGVRKFKL